MKRMSIFAAALALFLSSFAAMDRSRAACNTTGALTGDWTLSALDGRLIWADITIARDGKITGVFYSGLVDKEAGKVTGWLRLTEDCRVTGSLYFDFDNGARLDLLVSGYQDGNTLKGYGLSGLSGPAADLALTPRLQ